MNNISHQRIGKTFEEALEKTRAKISERGDLPHATVSRQLDLLAQLAQSDFGRFLIWHRGGMNGYWTYYAIRHSFTPHPKATPIERFFLERSPSGKAAQQRFRIMQDILQRRLKDGIIWASIPSGVMATFLTLNFSKIKRFELIGVDIDVEANRYAQDLASERGLESHVHFYERDAWKVGLRDACDGLVSHGLNYYEHDDEKVGELYRQFYQTLKPGGFLLTSYLTPPPGTHHRCEWVLDKISMEDALLQRIICVDILDSRWQAYRTTEQTRQHLIQAGFSDIQIFPDEARVLPVALAYKKE